MNKVIKNISIVILFIGIILLLMSHWLKMPIVIFTAVSILFGYSIYDFLKSKRAGTKRREPLFGIIIWGILWIVKAHDFTQYIWHNILNN